MTLEEQFILRVPPSAAERIDRLLSEKESSSDDNSVDLTFSDDGRGGTFLIGNDQFPAFLLNLPGIVESYKSCDDSVLIKTADIDNYGEGGGDIIPVELEYRHGLTPPMRDARRRRFLRELDLNPELVQCAEKDLQSIMAGGTAENIDVETAEYEGNIRTASKKVEPNPAKNPDVPEAGKAGEAPERSDFDESTDSI